MSFIPPTRHIRRVKKLYKTILRLHSHLPEEMQTLGTTYARDEFRRHKKCTSHEANVFMSEWTRYAITLAKQFGIEGPKTKVEDLLTPLDDHTLDDFKEEQIVQLYELMLAATNKDASKIDDIKKSEKT